MLRRQPAFPKHTVGGYEDILPPDLPSALSWPGHTQLLKLEEAFVGVTPSATEENP